MTENLAQKKHEDVLRFIELYKENPVLWDPNCKDTNILNRKIAVEDISVQMSVSCDDVKRKLHNLRTQFRREVARMRRLKTTRPKWIYYNSLKFLGPSVKVQEENLRRIRVRDDLRNERVTLNNDNTNSDFDTAGSNDYGIYEDENTAFESFDESSQHRETSLLQHNSLIDEMPDENEATNSAGFNFQEEPKKSGHKRTFIISRPNTEERDEYAIFGDHVANELRQLEKNKPLQQTLKCSILQAILNVNKAAYEKTEEEFYLDEAHLEEY